MNSVVRLLTLAAVCAAVSWSSFAVAETLERRDPAATASTRELPWDGSESLTLEVPASVRFVQAVGPGKVVVTGPPRSIENFSVAGGVLSDQRWRTGKPLDIVVYAPKVVHFSLKGSDKLVVEGFDQPQLTIETVGHADVRASGQVGRLTLRLQGSGWADLSGLRALEADVSVTGSRHALLAATEKARISGNGSVVLVGRPKALELDMAESGRVFTLGD
jgi:putative autotransporter adhesin-like protein